MKEGLKWLLICFAFMLPIHQGVSSFLLGLSVIVSFFVTPRISLQKVYSQLWDSWLYTLVLLLGLFYTFDLDSGWKVIETNLSLVAVPIIIVRIHPLRKEIIYKILYAFCAGLIISLLYSLLRSVPLFVQTSDWSVFYGDQLTAHLFNTHPVYFEYYLIMASTYGFYLLYFRESSLRPSFIVTGLSFFYLMMLLVGNGTATVGLLFVLLYFVLKYAFEERRDSRKIGSFVLALLFLLGLLTASSTGILGFSHDDYWERYVLWRSALAALPDWILGVGTGDYMTVLRQYYRAHEMEYFASSNVNPHNQFIETLFSNGIIGLGALIVMMTRPIYLSVRASNILGFLLLFPFLAYAVTEVFLGRFQGVAFYALLHQLIVSYSLEAKSETMTTYPSPETIS